MKGELTRWSNYVVGGELLLPDTSVYEYGVEWTDPMAHRQGLLLDPMERDKCMHSST